MLTGGAGHMIAALALRYENVALGALLPKFEILLEIGIAATFVFEVHAF